jgi:hypothetical protein
MANKLTERFDREKQDEDKQNQPYSATGPTGPTGPQSPTTTTTTGPTGPTGPTGSQGPSDPNAGKIPVEQAAAENQARIARGEKPTAANVAADDPHSGAGASPEVDVFAEQFPRERVQEGSLTPNAVTAGPTSQDVTAPTPAKTRKTTDESKADEPKP